jgi:ketosteroid isomerase-like protein
MAISNKAVIRRVVSTYGKGSTKELFECAAENIIWVHHVPRRYFAWGGESRGKKRMANAVSAIGRAYEFTDWKVKSVVGDGDIVWSLVDAKAIRRRSGRRANVQIVSRWTLRNGKVRRYDEYWDSASVLIQEQRIKPTGRK